MIWLTATAIVLIICFGGVVFFGAPYLPTLDRQVKSAMQLADLKSGQTLLELGCGDGKVLLAAAQQGINVIGYELNPILAFVAWLRTIRYRKFAKIKWGNFWFQTWPKADAIFVFLLPKYMDKLDTKINQYPHKPIKLVSFAFEIKTKKSLATKDGVYAYIYR